VRFAWGTGRSQQYTVADKTHSDHVPGTAVAAAAVIVVAVVAADMAVVVVVVNLFSISKKKKAIYHRFTNLRSPPVGFDIDFDHIHFEAPPGPPAPLAPRCHLQLASLYFA
jgi:hypothetical protein